MYKMRYSIEPRDAEATGDLFGNKIAYKITSVSKTSNDNNNNNNSNNNNEDEDL